VVGKLAALFLKLLQAAPEGRRAGKEKAGLVKPGWEGSKRLAQSLGRMVQKPVWMFRLEFVRPKVAKGSTNST
jgi:hypothetical protein